MEKKPLIIKMLEKYLEHLLFFIGTITLLIIGLTIFSPLIYALYLVIIKGDWQYSIIIIIGYSILAQVVCLSYEKYKAYQVHKILNRPWKRSTR